MRQKGLWEGAMANLVTIQDKMVPAPYTHLHQSNTLNPINTTSPLRRTTPND